MEQISLSHWAAQQPESAKRTTIQSFSRDKVQLDREERPFSTEPQQVQELFSIISLLRAQNMEVRAVAVEVLPKTVTLVKIPTVELQLMSQALLSIKHYRRTQNWHIRVIAHERPPLQAHAPGADPRIIEQEAPKRPPTVRPDDGFVPELDGGKERGKEKLPSATVKHTRRRGEERSWKSGTTPWPKAKL